MNRFNRWKIAGSARTLAVLLLGLHVFLSLNAARRLSPGWDEVVYPMAGFVQWKTGALSVHTGHPFLAPLCISFPLLFLNPDLPPAAEADSEAFRRGFHFLFRNQFAAARLLFWSRVPAVFFSILIFAFLFLWMESLWGSWGALASVAVYAGTPILCSRACAALLEMPMLFFILLSLYLHWRWMTEQKTWALYAAGLALGGALLCKLSALPLIPCFLLLEWFPSFYSATIPRRLAASFRLLGTACGVVVLLYLPWHQAWPSVRRAIENLLVFNQAIPFFWHDRSWLHAPSLLSWAAWMIKAPLCLLAVSLCGAGLWKRSGRHRLAFFHFFLAGLMSFVAVLCMHAAVNTVQLIPVALMLAGLAAGTAAIASMPFVVAGVILISAGLLQTARAHPNYLAFFNSLAGGSAEGYHWLSDSDQDWGQSLPLLAAYWRKSGSPSLLLAYSGAGDPAAAGLRYQDFMSPALVTRESQGTLLTDVSGPLWMAVSTKVIQTEPAGRWIFQNFSPVARPDPCFFIYDIGRDPQALRWVAGVYASTHRPAQARWALKRADQAGKSLLESPS
jgi:4-amino-4-deoxy-L-arabinose transferase-like glycosyltransferase